MDDSDEDQRLPHHRNPKEFVSFEKLDGMHIFEVVIIRYCRSVSYFLSVMAYYEIIRPRSYNYFMLPLVFPENHFYFINQDV